MYEDWKTLYRQRFSKRGWTLYAISPPFLYLQRPQKLAHDQRTSKTNGTSHVHFTQTMQFDITVETFNLINVV